MLQKKCEGLQSKTKFRILNIINPDRRQGSLDGLGLAWLLFALPNLEGFEGNELIISAIPNPTRWQA